MATNERSAAFDYGYVCGRMRDTLAERAATIGLTPEEVQMAIRLDADVKEMFDAEAESQEAAAPGGDA